MNLTPKYTPDEFNRFLFQQIDLDLYHHKFLNDYVGKAINGQKPLNELSVINTSNDGWILILHGEMLLIYGDKWNVDQFQEISEIFDLNKYTNYTLTGDNELIDALIKFYNPKNFEIEKRRLLYQTSNINEFNDENLKIRLGSMTQLNDLGSMLQEYYHEEYNGLNDKTIEEMLQRIRFVIEAKKIYVLLDKDELILSFCTIINPDIGIFFTKKQYRKKGYGKIILSFCSNLLKQENDIVYLMTDRDKIDSNTVCEKVGFIPYYKYVMTKINCG